MSSFNINPSYPIYPQFPNIPINPSTPSTEQGSVQSTFNGFLQGVSSEMQSPYKLAQDMATGQKPLDTAELMISILEAEKKLSVTVRVINELVKGLKQIESLQI